MKRRRRTSANVLGGVDVSQVCTRGAAVMI